MNQTQSIIFFVIAGIIIILTSIFLGILPGRKSPAPAKATIEIWGLGERDDIWRDAINSFQEKNKNLTIRYVRLDARTYEKTLINSLAASRGPDIFMLKNSWILKHQNKIYPLPQVLFNFFPRDFRRVFVDAVSDDLTVGDAIIGLPLFIDTLALFYNKDIFNAAGIAIPPQDWDEVIERSRELTKVSQTGDIITSGLAMGTSQNTERSFEILSALVLQAGDPIVNLQRNSVELSNLGKNAFSFYTSFANPSHINFSWNNRMPSSFDAFAEGKAAMVMGLAEDLERIRAKNPHINIGVYPFPQLKNAKTFASYSNYFFPTVSKQSKNPEAAWQFITFVTLGEGLTSYLKESHRPAVRRDLLAAGTKDAELDIFYRQALIARGWPIPDEEITRSIFSTAIDSVVSRSATTHEALTKLQDQLRQLLP